MYSLVIIKDYCIFVYGFWDYLSLSFGVKCNTILQSHIYENDLSNKVTYKQ